MSFSLDTEKLVNELIQAEYGNACEKFGDKYHSLHEGYAVLLEEVEESMREINLLNACFNLFWLDVKNDSIIGIEENVNKMMMYQVKCIQELAQVGAVLKKIQNTLKVEE